MKGGGGYWSDPSKGSVGFGGGPSKGKGSWDKDVTGGKDKGKGKKGKPKTPQDLGFELSAGGKLWVRPAKLQGGVKAADGLEVGNLDEKKLAGKGMERPGPGNASVEVLCNRQSILGNPYQLGKKVKLESMRTPVLAAYEEYLQVVMEGSGPIDLDAIARKHGLEPKENCAKDWKEIYDAAHGVVGVQSALAELRALTASERRARRSGIRLLCHCAPLPCHTQLLARRVQRGEAGTETEADGGRSPLDSLQGSWASKSKVSVCVATICGDALVWPSGGRGSLRAEGNDTFLLSFKSKEVRGCFSKNELVWDDGDAWVPLPAEPRGREEQVEDEVSSLSAAFARKVYLKDDPSPPEATSSRSSRWGRARDAQPIGSGASTAVPERQHPAVWSAGERWSRNSQQGHSHGEHPTGRSQGVDEKPWAGQGSGAGSTEWVAWEECKQSWWDRSEWWS